MTNSFKREWQRILKPGETLIWSATVSDECKKKYEADNRWGGFGMAAGALAGLGFGLYRAYQAFTLHEMSVMLGVLGLVVAVPCAWVLQRLWKFRNKQTESFPYAAYGATDNRLIALNAHGDIAGEISKDEMEDIIWVNDNVRDELLVLRANDSEGIHSFWVTLIEGLEDFESMIYKTYIRRKR